MIVPQTSHSAVPAFEMPKAVRCQECGYAILVFDETQVHVEKNGLGPDEPLTFYRRHGAEWGAETQIQATVDITLCDPCLES